MAEDKLLWTAEVDDKANAALKELKKSVDDVADATEEAAKTTTQSAKASKDATEEAGRLHLAIGFVKDAYGAVAGTIQKLVSAQLEQLEINQALTRSFELHGLSVQETTAAMKEAAARFAETQQATIYGDEAQARALTELLRVTSDVASAYDVLTISIDAAAHSGKSLEEATQALAKAQQGDISALSSLGILRQDEINSLNRLTDANKRTEIAMGLVAERTKGAAESADPLLQSVSQLENDFLDLQQSLGETLIALGSITGRFVEFITASSEGTFSIRNIASAFSGFADALYETADGVAYLWDKWFTGGEKANQAARDAHKKMVDQIRKEEAALMDDIMQPKRLTGGLSEITIALLEQAGEELEKIDKEERERQKKRAAERAQRKAEERLASEQRQELLQKEIEILYAGDDLERIRMQRDREILAIRQQKLPAAEEELRISLEQQKAEKEIGRLTADRQRDLQQRNELALAGLNVLMAQDDLQRAALVRERELIALSQRDLTDEEQRLENLRIQQAYEDELQRIEKVRIDERKTAEREAHDARMKQLDEEMARQRELFSVVQYGLSGLGGQDLGNLVGSLGSMAEQMERMAAAGASSGEAFSAGLGLASKAVGGFADSVIEDTEKAAFIKGLFEAASAAAAYAALNIPMGIAHTAAAASFFAVAGGAGPTASKTSSSASSTVSATPPPQQDQEHAIQAQKRAYLEALREHEREGTQTTIVNDMRGAYLFERDPVSRRRARQAVEGDDRLRLG